MVGALPKHLGSFRTSPPFVPKSAMSVCGAQPSMTNKGNLQGWATDRSNRLAFVLQGGSGWLPMARFCTGPAAETQRMKPSSSFFAHVMISLFDCPEWTLANIVGWIARAYICAAMSGGAG